MKQFNALGLLALIFAILKLTGQVDWSWVWVLCPLWIPSALAIGFIIIFGTITGIAGTITAIREMSKKDEK